MARNAIDEESAFKMLRDHSQHTGRKLADLADAIVQSHLLLLPQQTNGREQTTGRP
jgi:AmiR/NasT family two-component response regulator